VRPYEFTTNGDNFGWHQDETGNWHLNLFIEGGRVVDSPAFPVKTGLREIAKVLKGEFRLTANQNLAISNIPNDQKAEIEVILEKYNILKSHERSALRLYSIACVSLPTCGLALAEAERYLPVLVTELEEVVEECGLRHDAITIRMTGCPNGCGRPFLSEIAFVGRGPGRYNLYLGGGHAGQRLNKLYRQDILGVDAKEILKPLIEDYAKNRQDGERFGDFVIRAGYVEATVNGLDFHKNIKSEAIPS
jgi:sulfite reductase (NADPH) hemoprotein beta-component